MARCQDAFRFYQRKGRSHRMGEPEETLKAAEAAAAKMASQENRKSSRLCGRGRRNINGFYLLASHSDVQAAIHSTLDACFRVFSS
jgi:hypothetical protein